MGRRVTETVRSGSAGGRCGQLGEHRGLPLEREKEPAREHAARALELSREHGYGLFEPRAAALVEAESAAGA